MGKRPVEYGEDLDFDYEDARKLEPSKGISGWLIGLCVLAVLIVIFLLVFT